MVEDTGVGRTNVRLEAAVQRAHLCPVGVERLDVFIANTSAEVALLQSTADGTHGGLRGKTRHA